MDGKKYNQISNAGNVRFGEALMGEPERSRMVASPLHLTTFNAGDIVPIYCREILPNQDLSLSLDFVIRQTTLLTPTMGNMDVDIFAFWVPNRVVNRSWKAVQGENYSGSWVANSVSLAPLVSSSTGSTQIPVGSVADYYGFPTQSAIPNTVLSQCHDLKFRGYVMIYNEYFRDQNYQPPVPMSLLNVYQGFLDADNVVVGLNGGITSMTVSSTRVPDGSYGAGAVAHELYGSGNGASTSSIQPAIPNNRFRATHKPFKANKRHDYFTTVLPSPQKASSSVLAPVTGSIDNIPVITLNSQHTSPYPLSWFTSGGTTAPSNGILQVNSGGTIVGGAGTGSGQAVVPSNLYTADGEVTGLTLSVDDLRMAAAVQQVYEVLARGGSRYRELVASFFSISVDDPYDDIPKCLGKVTRSLDLYQTAQTSASESGSTPQGNLSAFGYTSNGGHLFSHHFIEHGYVHVFAVVRHRNIYSSYLARDNFRMNMLDYYTPQLANISEQPVFAREINPFAPNPNSAFGYQEAWAEYRFEPDVVSGMMRTMPDGNESLSLWNYADDFDASLQISNASWLQSNSEQVLNRTLAVTSAVAPQFKAAFRFTVDKELPMPTYSVPGMDII